MESLVKHSHARFPDRVVVIITLIAMGWSGGAFPAQPPPAAVQPTVEEAQKSPLVDPTTPEALFDAVVLMIDLGRPNLARAYMQRLLRLKPDDAALLRMRDKHGPAGFLRLANLVSLQPESVTLLQAMNSGFARFAADTERIDRLINELEGPPTVRDAAILQLRSGGALVVPRLIQQIGDVTKTTVRELLTYALVGLGPDVVEPMLAVLDAPDPDLRSAAVQVLGRLGNQKTATHLWYSAFSQQETPGVRVAAREALARLLPDDRDGAARLSLGQALRALEAGARRRLAGKDRGAADDQGKVVVWRFDVNAARLVRESAGAADAALFTGSRLAQQALALSPENPRLQTLFLALVLTRERAATPWNQALGRGEGTAFDTALLAGDEVLQSVLADALREGNATAAVAALEVLRQLATRNDLHDKYGGPSHLAAALNYPDPRVQFSAAMVIVEIDPRRPFVGSSRVVPILGRALRNDASRHAVLAGPKPAEASSLAGLVEQAGYVTVITSSGRRLFKEVAARGNVELIVLDANVTRWSLSQTVANLRADARTASIPIVVVGDVRRIASVERLRDRHRLMLYMSRPANLKGLSDRLAPFLKGLAGAALSAAERGERARAAVSLLGYLADARGRGVLDLRPAEAGLLEACEKPELVDGAVYALAAIPTASAQDRLALILVQPQISTGTKESAAAHLGFHVQTHGLLLKASRLDEIRKAHAAAKSDAIRSALAGVIGTLRPTAGLVGKRLRAYRVPGAK
ncbi:MAG: hypothetical protein CMJ65_00565 [Planctomycetaceae bacterium]|nr:hypothetical protein [Planctomycetaceae bacterium]